MHWQFYPCNNLLYFFVNNLAHKNICGGFRETDTLLHARDYLEIHQLKYDKNES